MDLYNRFIQEKGRAPDKDEASVIGRIVGRKVRANDGKLYPLYSTNDRKFLKEQHERRIAFRERFKSSQALFQAIDMIVKMELSPAELELVTQHETLVRQQLPFVLAWLLRFANQAGIHVTQEGIQSSDFASVDCSFRVKQAANDP